MLKKRKVKKNFCERILEKGGKIWEKLKEFPVLNPDNQIISLFEIISLMLMILLLLIIPIQICFDNLEF
jgi:hypothetical protein